MNTTVDHISQIFVLIESENNYILYIISYICFHQNNKAMIIITPTDLRSQQKKYLDLAETERVVIKRGNKLIHLVVSDSVISDEDLVNAITGSELKKRVFKHIDTLFDERTI